MAILLSICLGLGLSAACGFRIFVPFLVMSVAARAGHLDLSGRFEWISSDAALIAFGVAAVVEIAAYYVPWVDNVLDTASTPVAVVAGVVATAATVQDMSPLLTWSLAVIGGGGLAGTIQTGTALLRGASSIMTAGFGNPVISTAEAGGAAGLAALAVALPVVAFLLVMTLVLKFALRRTRNLSGSGLGDGRPVTAGDL